MDLRIRRLIGLDDELLFAWLDLYEMAFPANERVLVSEILATMKDSNSCGGADVVALAGCDEAGALVAMAHYCLEPEAHAALLNYLAVKPGLRGQRIGERMYLDVLSRIRQHEDVQALVFEVEMPERAHTPEDRDLSSRRIRFYQRLGAKLLTGISYIQSVAPHQEPLPMHIMVHPFVDMSPDTAFDVAQSALSDAMSRVSPLGLE